MVLGGSRAARSHYAARSQHRQCPLHCRLNVLVVAEQVRRIVRVLQGHEPLVIRPVGCFDTLRGIVKLLRRETRIRRVGTPLRAALLSRRPAPYLSLRPNSRIDAASLADSRPLIAHAVWV